MICSFHQILILKNLPPPSMGCWVGNIYHKFYKPLPKQVITVAKRCDVSFWPGCCGMIEELTKKGCKDVRLLKYMVVILSDYHTERDAKKIGKAIPNP